MTRTLCVVAVILGAITVVPVGSGSGGARLSLVDRQPLTIRGLAFKPYEKTRVVVIAQTRAAKTVRATRAGRFTVRFGTVSVARCGGVFATARGGAGSFARLKIPLPACLPVPQP